MMYDVLSYEKEGLAGPSHHHYFAKIVKRGDMDKCLLFFYRCGWLFFYCPDLCVSGLLCDCGNMVTFVLCLCFVPYMKLYLFNPENDLALADGNANYCAPPAARAIAGDLASLPLWFAGEEACVWLPGEEHVAFAVQMAENFALPAVYNKGLLPQVEACCPWGWSMQMRRRFLAMGVHESVLMTTDGVERVRELSNRRCAIALMERLAATGIDTPDIPLYCTEEADVARFVNSMPRSVIKAPWSGSGKGIAWGIGRVEVPVEHFYRGVIRRQGGVVCERFLDKVVDFAMEFRASHGEVVFAGYSLFTCDGGAYSGNVLASDVEIENFLATFVERGALLGVRVALERELSAMLSGVGYNGFLGVDMLVYRHGNGFRINPCVELNLRMNMGAVARLFHDCFVERGVRGRYFVPFYKKEGEALLVHDVLRERYPLRVENGRALSGYINLSPVTSRSRYSAYVLLGGASVPDLYAGGGF